MYILTQDRKKLLQLTNVTISKGIGNKFHTFISDTIVGTYPTEQLAINELEKIAKALQNREEVYIMETELKQSKD
jgi:rubrerythrin